MNVKLTTMNKAMKVLRKIIHRKIGTHQKAV